MSDEKKTEKEIDEHLDRLFPALNKPHKPPVLGGFLERSAAASASIDITADVIDTTVRLRSLNAIGFPTRALPPKMHAALAATAAKHNYSVENVFHVVASMGIRAEYNLWDVSPQHMKDVVDTFLDEMDKQ